VIDAGEAAEDALNQFTRNRFYFRIQDFNIFEGTG